MVDIAAAFKSLHPITVLAAGDLLFDTYTIGEAGRISPEAPVPIIHVKREESRPGGSGNVILNLCSLGCKVKALGRIGHDLSGSLIKELLLKETVDISAIFEDDSPTPIKNRIIAGNQQIVRLDHECIYPLSPAVEKMMIAHLFEALKGVDVVAISDYGKGTLTRPILQALIQEAKKQQIPVIVDPKGVDFTKYSLTSWIKPNCKEAYDAAGLGKEASLDEVAERLLNQTSAEHLMITRAENGLSYFSRSGERTDHPVKIREVKDVTGAGDTVLAMLCLAVGNNQLPSAAAALCNIAAGLAIERFGCARITQEEIARRFLLFHNSTNVYDEEHLAALKKALTFRSFTLISIPFLLNLTPQHLTYIRAHKLDTGHDILLYIEEKAPDPALIEMLASWPSVDYILTGISSLKELCCRITPAALFTVAEEKLLITDGIKSPSLDAEI